MLRTASEGTLNLTSTTFRTRRPKSLGQNTLNITDVSCRPLHDRPERICVHPPNKPSSTYRIVNPPPDRVYCQVERTRTGGETLIHDPFVEWWDRGEYWNRDSNIKRWCYSEVRRKASQGSHDVHRHDQINTERLAADRENPRDQFTTWIPPRNDDLYDPKPGAAKKSAELHRQDERFNFYEYPMQDGMELRPAAIYTKKFRKAGERAFRERGTWVW